MTPRQFAWLFDRHLAARRHIEHIIGLNTAVTYNTAFNRGENGVKAEDFMPSLFQVEKVIDDPARLSEAFASFMSPQTKVITKPQRRRK